MKIPQSNTKSKLKILSGLLVLVVLLSFILGSCNSNKSAEEYYLDVDKVAEELFVDYSELLTKLLSTSQYMYSAEIYSEAMSNFDYDSKEMPQYKAESQKKKWYKPEVEYLYIKKDGKQYVKITFTDMQRNESGELQYEDANFKNPIYAPEQVAEYWFEEGSLSVKVNGGDIYSGNIELFDANTFNHDVLKIYDIANSPNLLKFYVEMCIDNMDDRSSVFYAENKKVLADEIKFAKCVDVVRGEEKVGFRNSPFASGHAGDFTMDWEKVDFIDISNICVTSKKQTITQVEYNSEIIAAYQRKVTQIWNNETVVNWYGDRVKAERIVMELTYDTAKTPITIP